LFFFLTDHVLQLSTEKEVKRHLKDMLRTTSRTTCINHLKATTQRVAVALRRMVI